MNFYFQYMKFVSGFTSIRLSFLITNLTSGFLSNILGSSSSFTSRICYFILGFILDALILISYIGL